MVYFKGCYLEAFRGKDQTRLNLQQIYGHRRFCTAQHHPIDQVIHSVERMPAAIDIDFIDSFPAHKGGHQPGQTKDMIQVAMREEDVV